MLCPNPGTTGVPPDKQSKCHRDGSHSAENRMAPAVNQAGYEASALNCIYLSTRITIQRILSLQLHTTHTHGKKKRGGEKKRYRSLLTVIRQHCSSEVLMQPLLFYCSSNRMVMHTEVCAKGELREADIACVFGKPE